jgi:hypothetical protein
MKDVEVQANPYRAERIGTGDLSRYHPLTVVKRLTYMGASLWGLHLFRLYHVILRSPEVRHEWFKIGLAVTIGKNEDEDNTNTLLFAIPLLINMCRLTRTVLAQLGWV